MVETIKCLLLKPHTRVQFPVGRLEFNSKTKILEFTAFVLDVELGKKVCKTSTVCGRQVAA